MDTGSTIKRRQRLPIACEPCRERKRKCDGGHPCTTCSRIGHECYFRSTPRKRTRENGRATPSAAQPVNLGNSVVETGLDPLQQQRQTGAYARLLESNSGPAFVRLLSMAVDPDSNIMHPLQMLAWNAFLGERQVEVGAEPLSITDIISQAEMEGLTAIYLEKVDICYGFIDSGLLAQMIRDRWFSQTPSLVQDAVLCGIAALGCLFSSGKDRMTEISLVTTAKRLLDASMSEPASFYTATARVLRTVYLRLTAKPEEAWIASCTALHTIEAAGLHCEHPSSIVLRPSKDKCSPEIRKRIFAVAQHINIWMSFDLARSRVILQNADPISITPRAGNYTADLIGLLPLSEILDPSLSISREELLTALSEVLNRSHTSPPLILAHCNLVLCIYRRLHASKWPVSPELLTKVLSSIQRSIQATHTAIRTGSPWHHVSNIPFQSICTLLAIDTPQSFALLGEAMSCLVAVSETYQTRATKEAVSAARSLLQMHQKRRESDVKRQSEMLTLYPPPPTYDESVVDFTSGLALPDVWWFNDLEPQLQLGNLEVTENL